MLQPPGPGAKGALAVYSCATRVDASPRAIVCACVRQEPPNFPTESPPPSPQHARERAGDRDFALEPDWASPGTINLRIDPFFTEDFQLPAQAYDEVHKRVLRGPDDPPSPTDSTGPPSARKGKGVARSSGPQKKRGKAATNAGRRGTASIEPEGESSLSEMEDEAASAASGTAATVSDAEEEEAGEEEEEDEGEFALPRSVFAISKQCRGECNPCKSSQSRREAKAWNTQWACKTYRETTQKARPTSKAQSQLTLFQYCDQVTPQFDTIHASLSPHNVYHFKGNLTLRIARYSSMRPSREDLAPGSPEVQQIRAQVDYAK